jgi:hypothetical protein
MDGGGGAERTGRGRRLFVLVLAACVVSLVAAGPPAVAGPGEEEYDLDIPDARGDRGPSGSGGGGGPTGGGGGPTGGEAGAATDGLVPDGSDELPGNSASAGPGNGEATTAGGDRASGDGGSGDSQNGQGDPDDAGAGSGIDDAQDGLSEADSQDAGVLSAGASAAGESTGLIVLLAALVIGALGLVVLWRLRRGREETWG